jgi:hypothetical protein
MLLNRLEERANFKKDQQALQDSMNTLRNSSLVVHKSAPTQEKDLQPRPTYAGKYTSNNSKRPSLRELIEEQDKITNNLSKKLVANDKIVEDINVKMDNFTEILKDQAIFNAELESKLSKLYVVALLPLTLSRYLMSEQEVASKLKDRLGYQRGGSEWEPIKILLQRENSAYAPNSQPRIPTRVCQGHVVTTDLPTLGTNPKGSRSESETQEAKNIAALRSTRRTVRKHRVDHPQGQGGLSAGLRWTIRK